MVRRPASSICSAWLAAVLGIVWLGVARSASGQG